MRIAIVGTGISGLVAAYRLHTVHDVTVFEANDYSGGHTNTVDVRLDGERHAIDTGFMVFNDRTYPNFCHLLGELGVASDPTCMSFSVRCDRSGLEYNGTSLAGLCARRRNLISSGFYRMIRDILRFSREAPQFLCTLDDATTIGDYLSRRRFSSEFADYYLLPMGSAIWSCPRTAFEQFPVRFIIEFYHNHGLLSLGNRPTWRVIRGGSQQYVEKLTNGFRNRIRLSTPIQCVVRSENRVTVVPRGHGRVTFDEVIFACHSDQALAILGADATSVEREVLSAFPYEANFAVLHTDESVLPRRPRVRASWNYHIPAQSSDHATVTYNLNQLQHIRSKNTFCVTLNDGGVIDRQRVLATFRYSHPVFTVERALAQRRHSELIRSNRTSFCGAYWGNGFHEDGVNSALSVCRMFERSQERSVAGTLVHA